MNAAVSGGAPRGLFVRASGRRTRAHRSRPRTQPPYTGHASDFATNSGKRLSPGAYNPEAAQLAARRGVRMAQSPGVRRIRRSAGRSSWRSPALILFGFVAGAHARQPADLPRPGGDQPLRRLPARASSTAAGIWIARGRPARRGRPPHLVRDVADARRAGAARPGRLPRWTGDASRRYASRTMRWSGVILLLFIVYHLLHFTIGTVHPDFVEGDVYHNVVAGFQVWPVVGVLHRRDAGARACTCTTASGACFQTLGLSPPALQPLARAAFAAVFAPDRRARQHLVPDRRAGRAGR